MERNHTSFEDIAKEFRKVASSKNRRELTKIAEKFHKATYAFEDSLTEFVQSSGERWIKISNLISELSKEDFSKLKYLRPHADYLAKYKLLTLSSQNPKAGDAFVDLVAVEGASFVWSPENHKEFLEWRGNTTAERKLLYVTDIVELYNSDKIQSLNRFNPNAYIFSIGISLKNK